MNGVVMPQMRGKTCHFNGSVFVWHVNENYETLVVVGWACACPCELFRHVRFVPDPRQLCSLSYSHQFIAHVLLTIFSIHFILDEAK